MHIVGSFYEANGYGQFTAAIVRHLVRTNVSFTLTSLFDHPVPNDLVPYVCPANKRPAKFDVMFSSVSNCPTDVQAKVLFTMAETTTLPWEHGSGLKRFKTIIVPTKYSADAVRPWNKNIRLCPLGSQMTWAPIPFSPFTFVAVATDHMCPKRKRIQELADMFSATFKTQSDVRLVLKRSPNCTPTVTFDKRVEIINDNIDRKAYNVLMQRATVGVQVSAMEGWCLPVNEFMAMGRPVITPLAGAVGDYITPAACFPVEHTMRKAPDAVYLGAGKVPWANMEQVGQQMLFAYNNRFEVYRRGVAAYEASQQLTPFHMGERFAALCQTLF